MPVVEIGSQLVEKGRIWQEHRFRGFGGSSFLHIVHLHPIYGPGWRGGHVKFEAVGRSLPFTDDIERSIGHLTRLFAWHLMDDLWKTIHFIDQILFLSFCAGVTWNLSYAADCLLKGKILQVATIPILWRVYCWLWLLLNFSCFTPLPTSSFLFAFA